MMNGLFGVCFKLSTVTYLHLLWVSDFTISFLQSILQLECHMSCVTMAPVISTLHNKYRRFWLSSKQREEQAQDIRVSVWHLLGSWFNGQLTLLLGVCMEKRCSPTGQIQLEWSLDVHTGVLFLQCGRSNSSVVGPAVEFIEAVPMDWRHWTALPCICLQCNAAGSLRKTFFEKDEVSGGNLTVKTAVQWTVK